jgi:pyruvate carboxylase
VLFDRWQGARLVAIEAMKMETVLNAEHDAIVKAVHVKPGEVVAAKDLLVEFG